MRQTPSGSWVTTTVDSAGDVGQYTSIAIDSGNKAHISYYDCDKCRLEICDKRLRELGHNNG